MARISCMRAGLEGWGRGCGGWVVVVGGDEKLIKHIQHNQTVLICSKVNTREQNEQNENCKP